MERRSVTMRELQKMSASVIEALPHPMPITNGKAVIGLLSPVRKTDSEVIAKVVTEARAEFEQLSPEMQARIERFLADADGLMRVFSPSPSLVLDTNILVGAILGVRYSTILSHVSRHRALIASAEMARELRLVVARIDGRKTRQAEILLNAIEVVDKESYSANLDAARLALRNGPASRNGSTKDAHILALAWTYDADIWSHDRDFAGTGWPSWSSVNLAAALGDEVSVSAATHP